MKRNLWCLGFICLLSCKSDTPFQNYSDEALVNILYDLHLANTNVENGAKSSKDSLREVHYAQIEIIHSISRSELDSLIEHLHFDNERYLVLYDSLQKKIERDIEIVKEEKSK